jgi:hypothetical protein
VSDFLERLAATAERIVGPVEPLKAEIESLHAGFTIRRGRRAPDYQKTGKDCRAYLALAGVTNAARAAHVLSRHGLWLREGERGLDVGAGIGVSALALAARSHPDSEIHLVDRSRPALDLAERLFAELFPEGPKVVTRSSDLTQDDRALPGGTFRVTLAGHVLNELLPPRGRDPGPARSVALALARRSGTLVILEPAQRVSSRALSRVRGALLESRTGILGPCPHTGRCPVLKVGATDWCVIDVPFSRPKIVAQVDELLNLSRRSLTVSYLAVRKGARDPGRGTHEVLSKPMWTKSGSVIYLCGPRGRIALALPLPPKPPLKRGDRIRLPKGARSEGRDKSGAPRIRLETDAIERLD